MAGFQVSLFFGCTVLSNLDVLGQRLQPVVLGEVGLVEGALVIRERHDQFDVAFELQDDFGEYLVGSDSQRGQADQGPGSVLQERCELGAHPFPGGEVG